MSSARLGASDPQAAGDDLRLRPVLPPELPPELLIDQTRLARLLDLAGPELAPELLRQIAADLRAVQSGLTAGFAKADWVALRAQSHTLIALAGTLGAQSLHVTALALHRAAQHRDLTALPLLRAAVQTALADLIGFVGRLGQAAQ